MREVTAERDSGRWLDKIRDEIEKARHGLEAEREQLVAEKAALDRQITALEHEMHVLQHLATQSNGARDDTVSDQAPLSRRVLDVLRSSQSELTSREMRERLKLDHRESRNLGPVLNQLMKSGKVASAGRGAPWHLL